MNNKKLFVNIPGSTKVLDTKVYTVFGARVSMQRRELPVSQLPENETSCPAHQDMQEANEWRLPDLQTACRPLLSSREALSRSQVSCALLLQHQAETQATTASSTITTSAIAQVCS